SRTARRTARAGTPRSREQPLDRPVRNVGLEQDHEQQVGRECHGERHDGQRLAARAHDPERGEQREQQDERQAEPVQRGNECDGDQHHAHALAKRIPGLPQRAESEVGFPFRHLKRDPEHLGGDQQDQDAADDHAVRLRLPGEIGDRDEEVQRETERQRGDDEIRAQRFLHFFAVRSERYSFATATMPLAYSVQSLRSPNWIVSTGAPVLAYSSLYFGLSNTWRAVFSSSAKRSGNFSITSVWIAHERDE